MTAIDYCRKKTDPLSQDGTEEWADDSIIVTDTFRLNLHDVTHLLGRTLSDAAHAGSEKVKDFNYNRRSFSFRDWQAQIGGLKDLFKPRPQ